PVNPCICATEARARLAISLRPSAVFMLPHETFLVALLAALSAMTKRSLLAGVDFSDPPLISAPKELQMVAFKFAHVSFFNPLEAAESVIPIVSASTGVALELAANIAAAISVVPAGGVSSAIA